MLGSGSFYQGSDSVHDQLLLGQRHLLFAVEQTGAEIPVRRTTDDTLLPMDTVHTHDTGLPAAVYVVFCDDNVMT